MAARKRATRPQRKRATRPQRKRRPTTTRATRPKPRAAKVPSRKTSIGELRVHPKLGLLYVFEFHPDTERLTWLRYDTFRAGRWRDFPHRTATPGSLRRVC